MNKAGGFIVIHRQMLDWEWHTNPNTLSLFIHLLLMANYEEGRFEGKTISRGQLVTSIRSLSEETGLSFQQTRTALEHLILTGEITNKSHTKYRVITITNYDKYQDKQQTKRQTNNKQITNNLTNNQQQYNNITNINNKTNNNTLVRETLDETFAQFWEAYPRKGARQNAKNAWNRLKPDPEKFSEIMNGLKVWKESEQWNRDGGRYIPLPATWLNGKRWEDEINISVQQKPQSSGYPAKKLNADNFEQRDYSSVDQEMMSNLATQIKKAKEEGII